jgi:protein O-mannosyl-transferase
MVDFILLTSPVSKIISRKMSTGLVHKISEKLSLRARLIFILGLTSIILYANTFNNGFVLDDFSAIVKNSIVTKGISAIPEIFRTPYLHGFTINPNDLYRPLSLAMFAVEYQVFDGSPTGSHVINVLLFAGCVILLFLFLDALFERKKTYIAFLAALFFALHPIHTEVVANIKSRDELLCFFFAFLSLLVSVKYVETGKKAHLALGALYYFLSLLAKETSITFLFIIPFVFFLYRNENRKRSMQITVAAFAVAAVFLAIRFSVLHAWGADKGMFRYSLEDNYLSTAPDILTRIATAFFILGKYLMLLLIPYPLICDYSYNSIPFVSFGNIWVLFSLAAYLFLLCFGIYRLVKFPKDRLAFGILFFLLSLSLFTNIFFLVGAAMAERFLFFPSVGFCLILAMAVYELAWHPKGDTVPSFSSKTIAVILLISTVYGFIVISRNSDWKDAYTLYKKDLAHAPNGFRLYYYLGSTLINSSNEETDTATKNNRLRDGINQLKKSLAIYPGFAAPNSEIGVSYTNLQQYDSAERYDRRGIELNPKDTFTMTNLAAVYFKMGKYRESIEYCKKATDLYPDYARGYRNMGSCYLKMGSYDSAIVFLRKAISLQPDVSTAYYYLSVAYQQIGQADSANKYSAIAKQGNSFH